MIFCIVFAGCNDTSDEKSSEPEITDVTITFDLDYDGAPEKQQIKVKPGASAGTKWPQDPKRPGFFFDGWHHNEVFYTSKSTFNADIILKAKWDTGAEPPSEASLFADLTHTAPLKNFSHGNPLMTQDYGADPNVLVHNYRVYVYMTADSTTGTTQAPAGQSGPNDYGYIRSMRVLSSGDLVNWTQHRNIKRDEIAGGSWISCTWAPALAYKNNKVWMYFSNSTATAVISADSPVGPWTSPRSSNLVSSSTAGMSGVGHPFDPGILIDDDGSAYLYVGGATPSGGTQVDGVYPNYDSRHPNPDNMRVIKLNDDMISFTGSFQKITLGFTFEASEINKIDGKYYYSFSTNPQVAWYAAAPEPYDFPDARLLQESMGIGYAMSDEPMGPYTLTGTMLSNPGTMFELPANNNHHKIFEFDDEYYIVYHTKVLMDAQNEIQGMDINLTERNYRSTHIDKVTILPDGTFKKTTGTREGVPQVGIFDPYKAVSAATMAVQAGLSTAEYSSAANRDMKVTSINSGDWLALRGVNFGSEGAQKFKCRVTLPSASAGKGVIQIKIDGLDGPAAGYVVFDSASPAADITIDLLKKLTGIHDLVFVFYGSGYDFEEWQFLKS